MIETQLRGKRDLDKVIKNLRGMEGQGQDMLDVAVNVLQGHEDAVWFLRASIAGDLSTAAVLEEPGAPVIDRYGIKSWMTRERGEYRVRDRRPGFESLWYRVEGLYPVAMALLDMEDASRSRRGILVEEAEY